MFKSLVWLDPKKIPAQARFEPGTFRSRGGRRTTGPTRRSYDDREFSGYRQKRVKGGSLVATRPGARRSRVSGRAALPGVSVLCRSQRGWCAQCDSNLFCWLLNVPATCGCISGTDLLRQFYVLPHWDRSCRPNFLSHPVTVYWHRANQSKHWPYNARRLAG